MGTSAHNWQAQLAALPVSPYLSPDSMAAIERFMRSGSTNQRAYRVLEFFKAIDWLPLEEIAPNPLKQFAAADRKRIYEEIRAYFTDKEDKRKARREQRENYKLKVFEYFRTHVSQADKDLLERLRDYELEKIGQDINWRHYFWFNSFKQIDLFNSRTTEERRRIIARFIQDVDQHYKNAQRLRDGTYAQYYWGNGFESAGETFDEWANRQTWQADPERQQRRRYQRQEHNVYDAAYESPITKAYRRLRLSPSATLDDLRQQFRKLALQYHPDMPGGSEAEMKEILSAYNLLKQMMDTAKPY